MASAQKAVKSSRFKILYVSTVRLRPFLLICGSAGEKDSGGGRATGQIERESAPGDGEGEERRTRAFQGISLPRTRKPK